MLLLHVTCLALLCFEKQFCLEATNKCEAELTDEYVLGMPYA